MSPRRRSRLGAVLLIGAVGLFGLLLLLYAVTRPSAGRILAAAAVLGGAGVLRWQYAHRDDPATYSRALQTRSLVWSILIFVAFVGVSLLLSHSFDG